MEETDGVTNFTAGKGGTCGTVGVVQPVRTSNARWLIRSRSWTWREPEHEANIFTVACIRLRHTAPKFTTSEAAHCIQGDTPARAGQRCCRRLRTDQPAKIRWKTFDAG